MSDKPEGAKAGWQTLKTTHPLDAKHMKVRQDRVSVNGHETDFIYQEHPASVIIVPVTKDGRIVLIRQYRYAVDAWSLEVPAGLHDQGKQSLEETVRMELTQEIGATCDGLEHVGYFYSSPGASDETCHVFLATGVELTQEPEREPTETVETCPMPIADAYREARAGRVTVGPSALALFLCEERIRRRTTSASSDALQP
ncbi:MAG: NUDIX hydrolase [Armatimonadetes bacterium]|nr:NUDIX hydrolase [Armatimonadota bacterium]